MVLLLLSWSLCFIRESRQERPHKIPPVVKGSVRTCTWDSKQETEINRKAELPSLAPLLYSSLFSRHVLHIGIFTPLFPSKSWLLIDLVPSPFFNISHRGSFLRHHSLQVIPHSLGVFSTLPLIIEPILIMILCMQTTYFLCKLVKLVSSTQRKVPSNRLRERGREPWKAGRHQRQTRQMAPILFTSCVGFEGRQINSLLV